MATGARGADERRGDGAADGREGVGDGAAEIAVEGVAVAGVATWAKSLDESDGVVDEVGIAGLQAAAVTMVSHIATARRVAG